MVRAAAGSSRYRERALYLSLLSARRVAESLGCPAAGLSLWPPGADQRYHPAKRYPLHDALSPMERDHHGLAGMHELPGHSDLGASVRGAPVERAVRTKLHPRDRGGSVEFAANQRLASAPMADPGRDHGLAHKPQSQAIATCPELVYARGAG